MLARRPSDVISWRESNGGGADRSRFCSLATSSGARVVARLQQHRVSKCRLSNERLFVERERDLAAPSQ